MTTFDANWDLSPAEAQEEQLRLRDRVRIEPLEVDSLRTIGGSDISFDRGSDRVFAGMVTLRLPELELVERAGVETVARFPYIPGLLSFRESPPLLEAWDRLRDKPDALIVDGHGFAHPRRFGIACHLGLLLGVPTVGCAKSILVGRHDPVGESVGDWQALVDKDEVIGAALRTRLGVTPVYVSVGNRADLESAIAVVLMCGGRTRVPETTRHAHQFVNELRVAAQP
jgi:deoxyribonuclease V